MTSPNGVVTPARLDNVPNQPKTPQRTVRVPEERWQRAKREAERRGESVSDAINRFLERYGKERT